MKKIISVFAIAGVVIFANSCTTSADKERDAVIKAQQEEIASIKMEMMRKHLIDSINNANAIVAIPEVKEKPIVVQTVAPRRSAPATRTVYTSNHSEGYGAAERTPTVVQQPAPVIEEQPQKKGWSAKATGAVIGTAVGAGAGAVINKRNRAAGAAIGAVIGAAAGTGIGAVIDKKKGR